MEPVQVGSIVPSVTRIGGPPPVQRAGGGPSGTVGMHAGGSPAQPIPDGHATPQAPQCAESLSVSTQVPPHSVSGAGQVAEHPLE